MRAVSSYASAIVTAAMMASAGCAYAQDTKLSVPNVIVAAVAGPVEPYMRDPWKAYGRNPYFGRYRVEEDKLSEQQRVRRRDGATFTLTRSMTRKTSKT
jgi:hypothetical protein